MKIPNIKRFLEEKKKWKEAGEPVRSDERVFEIYQICKECEHFISLGKGGQCGICTCLLRDKATKHNKITYATTKCPLEEPKWIEEEGFKPQVEIQEEEQQKDPPKAGPIERGCGCK